MKLYSKLFKKLLALCAVFTLLAWAQTTITPRVDMVARATSIGGGTGTGTTENPFFESNLETMTNRSDFPRFKNYVGRSPVGHSESIHDFYIKNSGGGMMSRKCTLSGALAKNADGSYSDRLVLDFWKNGQPLSFGGAMERSLHVMTARDHDDDDNGSGTSTYPLYYVYAITAKDTTNGTATYELQYQIPAGRQLDLALACYSAQQSSMQEVSFTCTGNDITGDTDYYYNESFFCDIGAQGTAPTTPTSQYTIGGMINANSTAHLTLNINGGNYEVNNTAANNRYTAGAFVNGSYYTRIVGQSQGLSCTFVTGGQSVTIGVKDGNVDLPTINCGGTATNVLPFKDSFEE